MASDDTNSNGLVEVTFGWFRVLYLSALYSQAAFITESGNEGTKLQATFQRIPCAFKSLRSTKMFCFCRNLDSD